MKERNYRLGTKNVKKERKKERNHRFGAKNVEKEGRRKKGKRKKKERHLMLKEKFHSKFLR